jgi:hypothetical protein
MDPHSVGVLLTHLPTSNGPPDAHSFALKDHRVVELAGWARTGELPLPTKNPPEGRFTSLHAPLPDGLTDADRTAIHELLLAHKARFGEVRLYLGDGHPHAHEILRWVSTGCLPGSDHWATDDDPGSVELPEIEVPE